MVSFKYFYYKDIFTKYDMELRYSGLMETLCFLSSSVGTHNVNSTFWSHSIFSSSYG